MRELLDTKKKNKKNCGFYFNFTLVARMHHSLNNISMKKNVEFS
jgi:hypothetical protein